MDNVETQEQSRLRTITCRRNVQQHGNHDRRKLDTETTTTSTYIPQPAKRTRYDQCPTQLTNIFNPDCSHDLCNTQLDLLVHHQSCVHTANICSPASSYDVFGTHLDQLVQQKSLASRLLFPTSPALQTILNHDGIRGSDTVV